MADFISEQSKFILDKFQIRKSKKQKEEFRTWLCQVLEAEGYRPAVNRFLAGVAHADSLTGSKALDHPFYTEEIDFFVRQFGFDYPVVHFNNGIHGVHLSAQDYTPLYEKTILWLKERFPASKLILATSTSILIGGRGMEINEERNRVIVEKNAVVRSLAEKYGLEVDDLYPSSLENPDWRGDDGYHFTQAGTDGQGRLVADVVRKALGR